MEYFGEKCEGKQSCLIDPDEYKFEDALSEKCIDRVRNEEPDITSREYILVVGCRKDWVYVPMTF